MLTVMDWRDLPSLSALRAFEAAARCGSLSAAARELNVTHAAIAGHVRTLEKFFSTVLLRRAGQGMEPTPDGALLARGLSEGFETLAAACRDLSDQTRARPLAVTTTPTFAENWLMPRLGAFWAHHPDVNVSINPSPDVADLRRDGHDVAIRYGDGVWPGLEVEPLIRGDFVVAAAPALADRLPDASTATLLRQIWLMDPHRAEERYLAAHLDVAPDALNVRTLATNGMVLSATRAGLGLALQTRNLIEPDLASGRLREVAALHLDGVGYYLVTRAGGMSEPANKFCRWIRQAV
jgi:LysR family glycine cleavage system transcriptional activator